MGSEDSLTKTSKPRADRGLAAKLTKYALAVATAAMAVYGAIRPEEEAHRAGRQAAAGYEELAKRVAELQAWANASRAEMDKSAGICKAEVAAIQSYVAGYLLALSRSPASPRPAACPAGKPCDNPTVVALEALMRKMAREKPSPKATLPKLTAPAPPADIQQKAR